METIKVLLANGIKELISVKRSHKGHFHLDKNSNGTPQKSGGQN